MPDSMCFAAKSMLFYRMFVDISETRFERYFRTTNPDVRQNVAKRFYAVADECAARSNKAKTFCTDPRQFCRTDYIAYTLGSEITNCDLYWSFPLINTQCHGIGQATTTIHEMTHVDGLFDPSTDDVPGHYGWPALTQLPPEQAVLNGDNYGFYANGKRYPVFPLSLQSKFKFCECECETTY